VVSEGDWIDRGFNHLFAGPDLIGARLDSLEIGVTRIPVVGEIRYQIQVWGNAPEPTSAALFAIGL
jgi:hypothetical protein